MRTRLLTMIQNAMRITIDVTNADFFFKMMVFFWKDLLPLRRNCMNNWKQRQYQTEDCYGWTG